MVSTNTQRSRRFSAWLGAVAVVFLLLLFGWPWSRDVVDDARRLVLHGDVDQACELLREHLDSASQDDAARFLLATLQVDTEPVLALEELLQISGDFGRVAEVGPMITQIVDRLERDGTASVALRGLSDRFSDNVVLLTQLTHVLIRQNNGDEALTHAERLVELAPNSEAALLLLADAYDSVGRRTYMIGPLKQVLELSPNSYIAHANLAYAQRFANELDEGEANARWCLERRPNDVAVRLQLARILRDRGDRKAALVECRRVAEFAPNDNARPLLEAELLMYEGDFDEALSVLRPFSQDPDVQSQIQSLIDRASQLHKRSRAEDSSRPVSSAGEKSRIQFVDVANELNAKFRHHSPLTAERHLHLVMGSGVGWLDIDQDGWSDLVFGQGRSFDSERPLARDSISLESDRRAHDRLLQNLDGMRFRDVSGECRLTNPEYSMGIACGDWNNDGFTDLFVSCFGPDRLFVNQGDGTFVDRTQVLEGNADLFSASATWGDVDGDGLLDLYVANYLDVDPYDYKVCTVTHNGREFTIGCHPHYEPAVTDTVLLNRGDGTFQNATDAVGISAGEPRQGLGVVCADFDRDGDTDYYAANDTVDNQLWINESGVFIDRATISGVATNRYGEREAGMGVAVGDVTGNGLLDLFVTHFFFETNTLYANQGELLFLDVTDEAGLGAPSRMRLGFGATLLDADCDGWLDLFVANGHIHTRLDELGRSEPFEQQASLFRNRGQGRFDDLSDAAGDYFQRTGVGRGTAAADFDRDGKLDIAVQHLNSDASLLRNDSETPNASVRLRLVGTASSRDATGAIVTMTANGFDMVRARTGSTSYLSCDECWMHFGLPDTVTTVDLMVHWPGGLVERWDDLKVSSDLVIREGSVREIAVP